MRPQQPPELRDARVLVSRFPLQDDSLPLSGADLEHFHGKRRDSRRDDHKQKHKLEHTQEHA